MTAYTDSRTAPLPVLRARPPWRHTLIALSVRNYRLFAISHFVAMTAAWIQRVAQDWLVLELSGSASAVGITVAAQFAPMLLLGMVGGLIADRFPKRNLLLATQTLSAILSATLAVLALTGTIQVWHIYVLALLSGLVTVVDNPARQVFVGEVVGQKHLSNAISLNASIFQLGGLIGPAVSGALLLSVGAGWSFAINAVACLVVVGILLSLRTEHLMPAPAAPRSKGQLREALAYIGRKPEILWTLVMVGVLAVFAFTMPVLLASFADDVFHSGPGGYGLYNAVLAGGALVGAIASTRRASLTLRTVIVAGGLFAVLQTVGGTMPVELAFCVALFAVGVLNLLFITGANSLVQLSSNPAIRGRVMSVYILLLLGGQAIGGPVMGWIVESFGAHTGMVVSGIVPAVAAAVIALLLWRRRAAVRAAVPAA
ncbi:MFS transporter [Herbiconiux sp. L3-i23]|uniref:MFS transporter n=1 Tax=Herbiconiux sp. L3-i23 TaxID=2905871 RepID=UPI00206B817D|nr:MFS transporter [Herbiconiux sp. L3-i23]BDI22743.1 MFS transporter [Herbiconiux sp. L3-i23]